MLFDPRRGPLVLAKRPRTAAFSRETERGMGDSRQIPGTPREYVRNKMAQEREVLHFGEGPEKFGGNGRKASCGNFKRMGTKS